MQKHINVKEFQKTSNDVLETKVKKSRIKYIYFFIITSLLVTTGVLVKKLASYAELDINTNSNKCIVYIDDVKTNHKWLEIPNQQSSCYMYQFDVYVKIDDSSNCNYLVSFNLTSDEYKFIADSSFKCDDNLYTATVTGGEKTQIINKIYFATEEKVAKFDVALNINIEKKS